MNTLIISRNKIVRGPRRGQRREHDSARSFTNSDKSLKVGPTSKSYVVLGSKIGSERAKNNWRKDERRGDIRRDGSRNVDREHLASGGDGVGSDSAFDQYKRDLLRYLHRSQRIGEYHIATQAKHRSSRFGMQHKPRRMISRAVQKLFPSQFSSQFSTSIRPFLHVANAAHIKHFSQTNFVSHSMKWPGDR